MTEITRKITVDLARRGNVRLIFARQNDFNSRKIVINLTNAGVPFWVEKANVVLVNFVRPNGESAAFYGDVNDDGSVSIILGTWQLAVVGEVKCSVSIFSGEDQKLTSADFYLDVETALYVGDEINTDENYPALVGIMSEISKIKSVEQLRVEAENNRKNAEISRESFEAQRQSNEIIRDGCEVIRIEAENRRNVSESSRAAAELARVFAEEERNNIIGDIGSAIDKIIMIQQQILDSGVEVGGVV